MKLWLLNHIIPDWKKCFHFHSVKGLSLGVVASALATGIALVYSSTDASQHAMLPSWLNYFIFFLIFAGSFIGRLWRQGDGDGK